MGKLRVCTADTGVGVFRGIPGVYRPLKRKQIAKNSVKRSVNRLQVVVGK